MATERNFGDMINQYVPDKMLREESVKRDWILLNAGEKDDTWLSGDYIVPFKGANASSIKLGGLTESSDIGQSKPVRGSVTTQPESWASLIFYEKDVIQHGKLNEQNLMKLFPDEVEDMLEYHRMIMGLQLLNGAALCAGTENGGADGTMKVDRPERLMVGQKVLIDDDNSSPTAVFVKEINLDDGDVTFVSTRFGSTTVDISAYTLAQNVKLYVDGGETSANRFTNLKNALLPASQGGSSTLYGVTKTAYSYTQSIASDGSGITASNILDKLFDHLIKQRNRGAGKADKFLMSYKHWGSAMKILEQDKGPYRKASDQKASLYGWDEVEVGGPRGKMTLVALQEMDDNWIGAMDMSAVTIASNGGFRKRVDPDTGKPYFTIRGASGYAYVCDFFFQGDLILKRPNRCGVIYSVANY